MVFQLSSVEPNRGAGALLPLREKVFPLWRERMRGVMGDPQHDTLLIHARAMRKAPTEAEAALWRILRNRRFANFKFRRQVPLGPFIADFASFEKRFIVEADGSQHAGSSADASRDAWFAAQGFRLRRFWNADILSRRLEVTETLWHDLNGS